MSRLYLIVHYGVALFRPYFSVEHDLWRLLKPGRSCQNALFMPLTDIHVYIRGILFACFAVDPDCDCCFSFLVSVVPTLAPDIPDADRS